MPNRATGLPANRSPPCTAPQSLSDGAPCRPPYSADIFLRLSWRSTVEDPAPPRASDIPRSPGQALARRPSSSQPAATPIVRSIKYAQPTSLVVAALLPRHTSPRFCQLLRAAQRHREDRVGRVRRPLGREDAWPRHPQIPNLVGLP